MMTLAHQMYAAYYQPKGTAHTKDKIKENIDTVLESIKCSLINGETECFMYTDHPEKNVFLILPKTISYLRNHGFVIEEGEQVGGAKYARISIPKEDNK